MLLAALAARRLRIAWIDERSEAKVWRLLEQYRDVKLSLTDATCAVTARAGRIIEVFGCESDFEALGFVVLPRSPMNRFSMKIRIAGGGRDE